MYVPWLEANKNCLGAGLWLPFWAVPSERFNDDNDRFADVPREGVLELLFTEKQEKIIMYKNRPTNVIVNSQSSVFGQNIFVLTDNSFRFRFNYMVLKQ